MERLLLQARSDLSAAKKRVKESEERVDVKLPEFVKKKYWCVPPAAASMTSLCCLCHQCLPPSSTLLADLYLLGCVDPSLTKTPSGREPVKGFPASSWHYHESPWRSKQEEAGNSLLLACCRTEAREELRRQVGTLRFDLSSLAAGLDKPKRKEAARLQKDFFSKASSSPAPSHAPDSHRSSTFA